ncbi:unnamed protein product, partial [Ectocarpus sp. 12 AP-2014]
CNAITPSAEGRGVGLLRHHRSPPYGPVVASTHQA